MGFITYDSSVHFYKLVGGSPEMCVVCDKQDMFVPVPEGVLCDVNEAAENIEKLMDNIPRIFQVGVWKMVIRYETKIIWIER